MIRRPQVGDIYKSMTRSIFTLVEETNRGFNCRNQVGCVHNFCVLDIIHWIQTGFWERKTQDIESSSVYTHIKPHNGTGFVQPKCECGASAITSQLHSDWCPMYRSHGYASQ